MEKKERKTIRSQREQLLTLLNGWDPVGLLEAGSPRNEYDCVVDGLLGVLSRQASREEVAEFLDQEMRQHFGTTPRDADQFANKVVTWFHIVSREQS